MSTDNATLQQQLIGELLAESDEGLDRFDRELMAMENGGGSDQSLNVVFRAIHTIKGTAGCLGLQRIESVAHAGENLLSLLRDGKLISTPEMIVVLLQFSDALKQMMKGLKENGDDREGDFTELVARLHALQTGEAPSAAPVAPAPVANATWGIFDEEPEAVAAPVETSTAEEAPVAARAPEPTVAKAAVPAEKVRVRATDSSADSAIRVDVGQLDKLMNLVGELVLARNQIVQHTSHSKEPTLLNASQRLNIITTELQESVMKTRMQPIENVWAKFPRIVRDVARDLGKLVNLVMEGKATELDRTIIEAIKDPLTHMVRNSIDHGIETPDKRRAAGKPETGTLILRAFHEGGQVNIEILDDGAGINVARVKQKALDRGLITAEQAGRMPDREAYNLIFMPGLSTADKVTNVSGRGVGMDVVRTNVEKIGGAVDVSSDDGQGSRIKLKIPLTLAIIPALIVSSGGERFAIPQVSLLELVRLEGEQARKGIESLYGSPILRLRGQLLPLAYLNRELQLVRADAANAASDVVNIVVLQADGRQFGLIVDQVNDTEEIVVKPLSKQLRGVACFAGATIMGDGRVALILDVLGLAHHAEMVTEVHEHTLVEKASSESAKDERQTLLLFKAGSGTPMAMPLSVVARLEEFAPSSIERAGDREVVQYRGQILPLIRVSQFFFAGEQRQLSMEKLQVVVYAQGGRSVGLIVDQIHDIVHEALAAQREVNRDGVLCSAVIHGKVTDVLDVEAIIRSSDPGFYAPRAAAA